MRSVDHFPRVMSGHVGPVSPGFAMVCHALPVLLQETAGGGFRVLLTDPQVRRPLSMAIILMALQQYCGINGNLVIEEILKC